MIFVVPLLLLVAAVLLILPFRGRIAIRVLEARLEKALGVAARIESLEGSIRDGRYVVRGLRLLNEDPSVVPELMVIPSIELELDLRALFSRDVHLRALRMEVSRIIVVRDELGRTNIDAVSERMKEQMRSAAAPLAPGEASEPGVPVEGEQPAAPVTLPGGDDRRYTIGELVLTIGQVELHGVSSGGRPMTPRIYPLPENSFRYENVDDIVPVGQDIMTVLALFVGPQLQQDLDMLRRAGEIRETD